MGVDGATYKAVEYTGSAIRDMSTAGRMTLCNMSVEMGAKNGIIEADGTTRSFLNGRTKRPYEVVTSDADSEYEKVFDFDVSGLRPTVACPSSVGNVKPASELGDVMVEQAFIGSCTNGRIEDLRLAAKIMKGRTVKEGVRALVIPASQEVYRQALDEGLVEIFTDTGALVCGSACGPCLGGHIGLLAPGETCISTSNRNFVGRMGSTQANVYLASPATVAASALTGRITDPGGFEV
jgi:3-isopropylmalate/(R)-2-methylmalate dehydratase large subunit